MSAPAQVVPIRADALALTVARSLAAMGLRLKSGLRGEVVVVPATKAVRHG